VTGPQPPRAPLDLRRPRDVGGLISEGFNVYFREFGTFFLVACAVVVPVNLIVLGVGLGWFTGKYDPSPPPGEAFIPLITNFLVVAPLLSAMCIHALLEVAEGRKPRAGTMIQRGLDVFAPLVLVMLLYAGGVTLGLFALILPGIYLLVRWSFCIQAAVVDGRRGPAALARSGELVTGMWWRVAGITLAANFLAGGLSAVAGAPFAAAADATDQAVFQLVGQTVGGVLFAPAAALITTLLYFDQRLRKGA
jgi:hypothetical protein